MDRELADVDSAGVEHSLYSHRCGPSAGATGHQAAAAASPRDGDMPSPQGAVLTVLW